MEERWLSILEYARALNISDMTVRRRIRKGKLKATLREGKYFIFCEGNFRDNSSHDGDDEEEDQKHSLVKSAPVSIGKSHTHTPHTNAHLAAFSASPRTETLSLPDVEPRQIDADQQRALANQIRTMCEKAVQGYEHAKDLIAEKYEAKISSLESLVELKTAENRCLLQQVEDLELLIKTIRDAHAVAPVVGDLRAKTGKHPHS